MFEFVKDKPIYLQIADDIIDQIVVGKKKSGDKLESIRVLAGLYSVNPNTIQRTTQYLLEEGLIEAQRGVGNIISSNEAITKYKKKLIKKEIESFMKRMTDLEVSIDTVKEYIGGWEDESKAM